MNQKKVLLTFILTITLIGFGLLSFQSDYLAKVIYSTNSYSTVEDYEVQNSLTEEEINELVQDKYLLLYDETDALSISTKDNIVKVLEYAKKAYEVVEAKAFEGLNYEPTGIIICFEDLDQGIKIEALFSYAEHGGSLLFAVRPMGGEYFGQYEDALGIQKLYDVVDETGMHLLSNILIQGKGFATDDEFMSNSCLEVDLTESAVVHARATSGLPLLWENNWGQGKIIINNTTMFNDTKSRGYILGTISLMSEDFIYPIVNAKVNFIDDFPSPVPEKKMGEAYNNLNMSVEQFYRNIWWPSILNTAKNYNMLYSGTVIECYADNVHAPFIGDNVTAEDSLFYFGQELLQNGGEMGIHGFNHQSFSYDEKDVMEEDYNVWESEEDVAAAWKEIYRFVNEVFPDYEFRSYVAPSNILSREIRQIIPKVAPDLKVICGLYGENEGKGTYNQEFEVAEDGIIEFPRISSGYMEEPNSEWDIYNGISLHGIISHFIHPDDVLSEDRNAGQPWEELTITYNNIFKELHEKFSWLRAFKVSDAATELQKSLETNVYLTQDETGIYGYCNNFRKDMYFILRTDKKITATQNCSTKKIDENVYWVYTQSPEFSIALEEVK
nr:DUF2194 domain-containing protein [uncultured Cellulosilyticum sp.]